MGKDDSFFFEEDPKAQPDTGLTPEEHANTFLTILEDGGIIKDRSPLTSFDPMKNVSEMNTQKVQTNLVEVEYGIVKNDYVVHVIPIHPHKNLKDKRLLDQALQATILILNKIVPTTLNVDIYLPRADFEIKATSYVIREAADSWNFDSKAIEAAIPTIMEQVGQICMKA
jgi:hypothetical protein